MRQTTIRLLVTALFLCAACPTRPDNGNGGDTGGDNTGDTGGDNTGGDTGTPDGGDGGGTTADYTKTTVGDAYANHATLHSVEIDDATVVDANSYAGTTGGTIGTFYIQDGTGQGLAVYHGSGDSAVTFPNVGDVVTVQGHLSTFDGSLQISSSTKYATPLTVTVTGAGQGTVPDPLTGLSTTDYAPTADPHDDQVGHVLQFDGPLTITDTNGLVSTSKTDGSTTPEGFTVTGGLLVDDSFVYHDCIKPLANGVQSLDLSHGIRGVWDRYQDFYAAGSSAQNPAPVQPVLFPMSCDDLNPAQ